MAGADSVEKLEDVIVRSAEQVAGEIRAARDAISTVIFGQQRVVENTLVTILAGGHALLIGVPGLAKTKLVETLGVTLGLDAKRIQFMLGLQAILHENVDRLVTQPLRLLRFQARPIKTAETINLTTLHRKVDFIGALVSRDNLKLVTQDII